MAPAEHSHRPTLKQKNKGFKARHATKGSIKEAAKGRVGSTQAPAKQHKAAVQKTKQARLNTQAQKRDAKRKDVGHDQKFFSTSSGGGQVPRIISLVPLLPSCSPKRWLQGLVPCLGMSEEEVEEVVSALVECGSFLLRAPRFKTMLHIHLLPPLSLYPTLDAALASDYVVILMSSTDEVQLEGEAILRCLQGQAGGGEVVACVQSPVDQPITPQTKQLIHKSLLSFITYFFPSTPKIHSSDTPSEAALLARALCEGSPDGGAKGDGRAYLVAEGSDGVQWAAAEDGETGTLRVEGTVRGGCLSADRLVHLPGHGDFQVELITAARPLVTGRANDASMALDPAQLSSPTAEADDLTSENTPDLMANEQTWPTEEEMEGAQGESSRTGAGERRVKRVPKGTSAYQAAWILDDETDAEEEEDDDEEGMDEDGDEEGSEPRQLVEDDEEETEEVELDERREEEHEDMDQEEEEKHFAAYLREREKAQREDQMFPDEIDTPRHIPAQIRFQRYRGLKSFRTSPWDPYENLPVDYAKVFQFESWNGTKKRVEAAGRNQGVAAGTRVVVFLKNVPRSIMDSRDPSLPFILHGLFQHEHKQSVLHFVVQRNTEYDGTIKAKDPLIMSVGPRRYRIRPVYSAHVRGGAKGVNNVHKSEKFLRPGKAAVATTYGPACFGKTGCLLLKEGDDPATPELVATGSFLSADPTRINAKRIILTGHPYKVHKKTATIRYMFFNKDDIEYFKSVELHTKSGRVGHIKASLGTHGYFKAHFDGPIQQMDSVCMSLYKRQFPKWSEEFRPAALVADVSGSKSEDVDEMVME